MYMLPQSSTFSCPNDWRFFALKKWARALLLYLPPSLFLSLSLLFFLALSFSLCLSLVRMGLCFWLNLWKSFFASASSFWVADSIYVCMYTYSTENKKIIGRPKFNPFIHKLFHGQINELMDQFIDWIKKIMSSDL